MSPTATERRQTQVSQRGAYLSKPTSFLLDVIRLSAAILVVIAHCGHPEFATGFKDRQILGDIAVPIFFVLSGFVIRYVARRREHTLRQYLIDRASRMYSVILPATFLTLALTMLCARIAPAYYGAVFAGFATNPLQRLFLNLIFLSQSWSHATVFFIDSPFWSLSYECLYYLGYGLFFYLKGTKRVVCVLLWAIVAGPQVLFLLPIWALGCLLYEVYRSRSRLALPLAVLLMLSGTEILYARNPLLALHLKPYRATMMAFGTGVIAGGVLLVLAELAEWSHLATEGLFFRRFRIIAGGTFALYLFHYPLMVLAQALNWFKPSSPVVSVFVLLAISVAALATASPLDHLKDAIKGKLSLLWSDVQPRGRSETATKADTNER